MNLTQLQQERLEDLRLDMKAMHGYLQSKFHVADNLDREKVVLTLSQLQSVLNVFGFVASLHNQNQRRESMDSEEMSLPNGT